MPDAEEVAEAGPVPSCPKPAGGCQRLTNQRRWDRPGGPGTPTSTAPGPDRRLGRPLAASCIRGGSRPPGPLPGGGPADRRQPQGHHRRR